MGTGFYQSYDRMIRQACPDYDYCLRLIATSIPPNISSILDLGSGTGNLAGLILKNHPRIKFYGIELRPQLVRLATSRLRRRNVRFIKGDILKVDWPKAECVTSSLTIHHFTDAEKERTFRKIYNSSNHFFYYDRLKGSSYEEDKHNLDFLFEHMSKNGLSKETIKAAKVEMEENDNPLTKEQLNQMLKRIGFNYRILYLKKGLGVYHCTRKE
jgi:ubiquinone/menaquinone biosynthesis C-methylase UbiE